MVLMWLDEKPKWSHESICSAFFGEAYLQYPLTWLSLYISKTFNITESSDSYIQLLPVKKERNSNKMTRELHFPDVKKQDIE